MTERADRFTQIQKQRELSSDFSNSFQRHPVTNALSRIVNENAIKQSIKNLVMTNRGERPFEPDVGCDVHKALFEPNDIVTAENIEMFVRNTLVHQEPRIELKNVTVNYMPDSDTFKLSIAFFILNTTTLSTLDLLIKRVR